MASCLSRCFSVLLFFTLAFLLVGCGTGSTTNTTSTTTTTNVKKPEQAKGDQQKSNGDNQTPNPDAKSKRGKASLLLVDTEEHTSETDVSQTNGVTQTKETPPHGDLSAHVGRHVVQDPKETTAATSQVVKHS